MYKSSERAFSKARSAVVVQMSSKHHCPLPFSTSRMNCLLAPVEKFRWSNWKLISP